MRALIVASLLASIQASACTAFRIRQPGAVDTGAAYIAVLNVPGILRTGRGVALGTQRMSDSGTYEASGQLSEAVVNQLMMTGLVQDVCSQPYTPDAVPDCNSRRARNEVRVSRLIPVGDSVFAVFIGQRTLRLPGDSLYMPSATTHLCRLVRGKVTWTVRTCELRMMT